MRWPLSTCSLLREGQSYSRLALLLTIVIYVIITYAAREIWKKALREKMNTGSDRSLLIITTSDVAAQVVANMKEHNYARYTFAGVAVIDRNMAGKVIDGVEVVANMDTAPMYVCQEWIDEVLVVISDEQPYPQEMMEASAGNRCDDPSEFGESSQYAGENGSLLRNKVGNYTVLTTTINYASSTQLCIKRIIDIMGGLVGCILTGVIFIFIAPAIYISSPGPIFFSQTRIGQNGKPFKMYKFRSMYMDAEERKAELMAQNKMSDGTYVQAGLRSSCDRKQDFAGRNQKNRNRRIYPRKQSLDEFPQFLNVLKWSRRYNRANREKA